MEKFNGVKFELYDIISYQNGVAKFNISVESLIIEKNLENILQDFYKLYNHDDCADYIFSELPSKLEHYEYKYSNLDQFGISQESWDKFVKSPNLLEFTKILNKFNIDMIAIEEDNFIAMISGVLTINLTEFID